eukprot:TRINITY_DN43597_c0_g2_i2.p1 TRINITY_DN43597_c0_g2~~TRINITY_DN43597_c0_g2_i2.p1  ORF type:complete len:134 (+),score=27.66 TRINITY_DN43597_c0_g2_i2:107-508(+)
MIFFFQAEDGIRDAQESRGLGDVYKRQDLDRASDSRHGRVLTRIPTSREYHDATTSPLATIRMQEYSRTCITPLMCTWKEDSAGRRSSLCYTLITHTRPPHTCLLYTSDAADEEDSVDLGGRRIIKKKKMIER